MMYMDFAVEIQETIYLSMILVDFHAIFAILFAIRENSSRTEHSDVRFYLSESTLSEEIGVCVLITK